MEENDAFRPRRQFMVDALAAFVVFSAGLALATVDVRNFEISSALAPYGLDAIVVLGAAFSLVCAFNLSLYRHLRRVYAYSEEPDEKR